MTRSQIYGIIGSILTCILVVLLLFLITIGTTLTKEEEEFPYDEDGIMMSYGNSNFGGGEGANYEEGTNASAPSETSQADEVSDPMAQDDESPVVIPQKTPTKKQPTSEELEAAAAAKAAAKAKAEAEAAAKAEQARKEAAIAKANKLGGILGSGTGSTGTGTGKGSGSGTGTGNGLNGNPAGKGSSGGNGWSLAGRSLKGGLGTPYQAPNTSGKIIVEIRVNQAGSVTSATIASGTTISDSQMRADCIAKAKNVKFSAGTSAAESVGYITYNFAIK